MSQTKNRVNLSDVSDKFTEEVLADVLCKAYKGKKVQLTDWNFGEGFAKGDNYMSHINKGTLYGITDDSPRQQVQVNFFVKSISKNIGRRKTFRCGDFFGNEIIFYTKIVPKIEKFLAERGQGSLLRIPRYLASYMDGENDFIVLEDVSPLGFEPASRQNCLDWTECTVILETLAKFHAISLAYRDQKKEEFAEFASYLKENYFGSHNWNWFQRFHKTLIGIAKHALMMEYPNSKAEKQFNSYEFGELYDRCTKLCEKRDASTSVISAGDCWAPNFLVRDIGENKKEALMLDFQHARCASPITDLSFLVYSCTQKSFRDEHYDDILKIYHSELSSAIKSLGSDPEKIYPWDFFMREVKETFIVGLMFSLEAIPFCLLDSSQSFDLDVIIKSNEAVNIDDVWTLSNIETSSGRRRLADVIVHAVENGYL
ncbi:PREDICTED: uncharacterized protein LOC105457133 [Wasmannia auropunctata]|uniref:uncharacterized protein LOC105457133 n=1 Tax=Wasmannia auropunctata TaxID=64793 RepID=UPI0005ED5E2E|nr:PREDICTED: uncharacterized protein LOC105457133 [Wasmannia auropunctata]XP_011699916.1 PREDICTED: uncharacterized protein LOC105457133 [Wasmannia auropunctata]XP_011699917.1 PREDICTED: uncharacterized protein LOC105457133 [Wasmannia auropunctata]XP_011699918.1 PREDICTED: uncharacterized protein LOC105457133 [Wasmannia auropunctata]XP_011699919.1 PREDICTED: uncharacterized protein LOC105457133 [Wasmannia auropunctata]XP_011699920.1 PREDICTED: uncharacterized protein LOC105457133 [Wasmannia a